ncbi:MAG TPA: CHAT domain-containing protein [Thermoanaerobaculia bacterium]|nr:CHAT domain-containing protein [Thermoanaerobaculia bacterium]
MAETPPEFIAHRAQILWQIGLVSMARTQWGYCIDTLSESAVLFERLDERTLAARIHQSLGTAYDQIGSPVEAEKHRMLALRGLGQQSSSRLQMLLTSLSLTAARDEDWPTAVSVFGLAIDVAKRVDDPLTEVSSRLRRARLHVRMNDRVAALADLNAARAGLHRVREPEYRLFLEANAMSIEAALASPESAIRLLTGAVDFHRARGQRMFLSELLLERGRAFRRIGDDTRAAEDFEQGVSELESRRETLAVDDRMGIFHEADGLFEEAIALALKNRRPKRAFDYAERARARALLDALGVVWQPLRAEDLPEDSVLLEYVTRADRIEIFVVDRSGVRVVERPVERVDLVAECAELVNAASAGDVARLRRAGRALHRRLVEPVEVEIIDKRNVVFVPDPKMGNVPFAALVDAGGRFLIERYPIEVVPSAAAFARLASERTRVDEPRTLIVTGADEGEPLPATEREADRVAAVYRRVTRLSRDLATRNAFAREAMRANVIHFAGHAAAGGAGGRDGYLRLKGGDAVDGQLGFREIAAMRLRNTDVVVLAACSTAAGEIRSSEGTISVARAFLAAGVPSVIATMWPIEDELAADFFPVIHGHISRGLAPAEALRAAQLDWIQRGNESAALWTAVQLVGH